MANTRASVEVADSAVDVDVDDDTDDIAAWARPAYAESYRLYLLDGARYGHYEAGMMRWIREQVYKQREQARKAGKGRDE